MAFDIFLVALPGLEDVLADEARETGFPSIGMIPGGVTLTGGWPEVWRANIELRGATRVLARIAEFRAFHLAQLDKRARKVDWVSVLRPDVPVRVEVSTKRRRSTTRRRRPSASNGRSTRSWAREISKEAAVQLKVRIDDNLVTISVDTSGESLHKRGHKLFTGKAPIRETHGGTVPAPAGFTGAEPVVDPMCGSGTFVIEAAEIAAGLEPGRDRGFRLRTARDSDDRSRRALRSPAPLRPPSCAFTASTATPAR